MASSLRDSLAEALPKGVQFTFHHIISTSTRCDALYASPPGKAPEPTWRESHFITVSIPSQDTDTRDGASQSNNKNKSTVFVFALELLVYTTANLTTIFVSKADSTGYLSLLPGAGRARAAGGSPVKVIARSFVLWLARRLRRQRPGVRLNITLFARAQGQYLFPESVDNGRKHVLDDRGLVRWWCSVLDPIVDELEDADSSPVPPKAHLIVPGLDKYETLRFTPRSASVNTGRWSHGHPLRTLSFHPEAPPRCLVPRFPDDPKARFVDELDDELPDAGSGVEASQSSQASPSKRSGNGQWRSVRTLDAFWEMMAYRQECSSGRLVGFIWLVFEPIPGGSVGSLPSASKATSNARSGSPSGPAAAPTRKRKLTGIIRVRVRRRERPSGTLTTQADASIGDTPCLSLPERDYTRCAENLLTLSFGSEAATRTSTARWLREASSAAGGSASTSWGWSVTGQYSPPDNSASKTTTTAGGPDAAAAAPVAAVNMLNGSIIRKRKKSDETAADGADGSRPQDQTEARPASSQPEAVNVLGAGLVRKKAKS